MLNLKNMKSVKIKYAEFLKTNPIVWINGQINQAMINEKHDAFIKSLGYKKGYVHYEFVKQVNLTKVLLQILG